MGKILNTIRTSEDGWFEKALKFYTGKVEFEFIDDADLGFTKKDLKSAVNLIAAVKKKTIFTVKEVVAVITSLGISASGVYIILAAIADPDPTSKLGLLIAGGLIIILTGSYGALRALGVSFKVEFNSGNNNFKVSPSD